jgi:hypothetical protein
LKDFLAAAVEIQKVFSRRRRCLKKLIKISAAAAEKDVGLQL